MNTHKNINRIVDIIKKQDLDCKNIYSFCRSDDVDKWRVRHNLISRENGPIRTQQGTKKTEERKEQFYDFVTICTLPV
jgi:hypothetical protein